MIRSSVGVGRGRAELAGRRGRSAAELALGREGCALLGRARCALLRRRGRSREALLLLLGRRGLRVAGRRRRGRRRHGRPSGRGRSEAARASLWWRRNRCRSAVAAATRRRRRDLSLSSLAVAVLVGRRRRRAASAGERRSDGGDLGRVRRGVLALKLRGVVPSDVGLAAGRRRDRGSRRRSAGEVGRRLADAGRSGDETSCRARVGVGVGVVSRLGVVEAAVGATVGLLGGLVGVGGRRRLGGVRVGRRRAVRVVEALLSSVSRLLGCRRL